jgi:hypothetical protein
MTFQDLHLLLLILSLLVACTVIALQFVRLHGMKKALAECHRQLNRTAGENSAETSGEFRSSLLEATLKNRLENGSNWRRTPEKYRYAAALAEQGADAERIAELLQLPLPEVRQLIALRKAKGSGNSGPRPG